MGRQGVAAVRAEKHHQDPLVGGQWRLREGGKYEIVITDNRTAPQIPVGGKMEPIG